VFLFLFFAFRTFTIDLGSNLEPAKLRLTMEQNRDAELVVRFHFEHAFRLTWLEVKVDLQDGDVSKWEVVPLVDGLLSVRHRRI
jgi:hypothetical protein